MQVPIISGIYTDSLGDFRTSYPINLMVVPKQQGISDTYLRPADGIVSLGTGPGPDRGGINWNGVCYRIMGQYLCRVSSAGSIELLGDITAGTKSTLDYSFDRLALCSANKLYYYNGSTVVQVTDVNLGNVISFIWVDGYFMTTDGSSIAVTNLGDPMTVNPLKYGSSEADPDPIVCLLKLRNEPYAVNRYTIEVFQNVGGQFFPFQRLTGSQIMRGAVGTYAACVFDDVIAFVGSGRNEPPSVWLGASGTTVKIASREIDTILQSYTDAQLAAISVDVRIDKGHKLFYIHLNDKTLVYDANASAALKTSVWTILSSSLTGYGVYRARNFAWCYGKWIVGDSIDSSVGYFSNTISNHYGDTVGWEFSTQIFYNATNGLIFHEIELVALTGNVDFSLDPVVFTSYSTNGASWSQERPRRVGKLGQRSQRINWLQQGNMLNWRIQKFRGNSDARISPTALECRVEQLNV
jgi:hypothetical protein